MSKKKDKRKIKDVLKDMGANIANVVHNTISNVSQGVSNVIHDTDNAAQWLALAPFVAPMKHILKSRGIPFSNKFDELAKTFVAEIVMKNKFEEYFTVHQAAVKLGKHSATVRNHFLYSHFEENLNNLTPDEQAQIAKAGITGAGAGLAAPTGGISLIVAPIINAIIDWFRKKKQLKESGATLPPDEEKAVNDADRNTTIPPTGNYSNNPGLAVSGRAGSAQNIAAAAAAATAGRDGAGGTTTTTTTTDADDDDKKSSFGIFGIILALVGAFLLFKIFF